MNLERRDKPGQEPKQQRTTQGKPRRAPKPGLEGQGGRACQRFGARNAQEDLREDLLCNARVFLA